MSLARSSDWMNMTGAFFQTRTVVFASTGALWEQALPANPMRWCLMLFDPAGGTQVQNVLPGPIPAGPTFGITWPSGVTFKWWDAPSLCTGPWLVNILAGGQMGFLETIYVGP